MLGIVLWSSSDRRKAVVWCEDHGPLAYLTGSAIRHPPDPWPAEGDVVKLTVETEGTIRRIVTLTATGERVRLAARLLEEDGQDKATGRTDTLTPTD